MGIFYRAAILSLAIRVAGHAEDRLLVGVLEDVPPAYVGDQEKQAVRVAFRKTSVSFACGSIPKGSFGRQRVD
jgi:hypothetical protein